VQKGLDSDEHSNTLAAMTGLASTFWNRGLWEDAEVLEMKVMRIREKSLGANHPYTISATASLAVSYRMQGQYTDAAELQSKVARATKDLHGLEHLDTVSAMANLASTYLELNRLEEAEQLQRLVTDVRKKILTEDHPDTKRAIANLATTRSLQRPGIPSKAPEKPSSPIDPSAFITSHKCPETPDEIDDLLVRYVEVRDSLIRLRTAIISDGGKVRHRSHDDCEK
jgi:hypothetical protein